MTENDQAYRGGRRFKHEHMGQAYVELILSAANAGADKRSGRSNCWFNVRLAGVAGLVFCPDGWRSPAKRRLWFRSPWS